MNFEKISVEKVQQYWDARPCNVRHSKAPMGTKEYFDEIEKRKYFVEPHIPKFAEFERWKDKKVLEIGCGIGTDTINFARAGAWVTAVDLSDKSLNLAIKRAKIYGLSDRITFIQANSEELSEHVPIECYDLIYSFGVIHHSPDPWKIIRQIRWYMGPETVFKVMVYHKRSWKVLWILLKYGHGAFWKIDELIAKYSEAQTGCPVTYTYTKKSVLNLFPGFCIKDIKIEHIFPYKIEDYKQYRYKKVWYFRWMHQWLFHWLEHKIGWHICLEAQL